MSHEITVHKDSHVDHGLSEAQLAHALAAVGPIASFTLVTIELPSALGTVPCGLYGPCMGDEAVEDAEAFLAVRGSRKAPSRCVRRPTRQVKTVTVIAGPHGDLPAVLYTAFGGPSAPREPADPSLEGDEAELAKSRAFWAEHALAAE